MQAEPKISRNPAAKRGKLIEATLRLMLRQGFAGTTVDDICEEAGVTKGSFFHHFESKEAIGQVALNAWSDIGTAVYAPSWGDPTVDPLEQLYRHLDIMIEITREHACGLSCMVGMMSQEMSATNPAFRDACHTHLTTWNDRVAKMLTDAKVLHPPKIDFDPESVAWMLNSLWQGSMLVAKTGRNPEMIVSNIQHGRAYVDCLFGRSPSPSFSGRPSTDPETKPSQGE